MTKGNRSLKSKIIFGLGAILAAKGFFDPKARGFKARVAKGSVACAKNHSGVKKI